MAGQWFFHADSEVYGPFSKSQLIGFVQEGRVTPATQVRNGESGPWRKAADVPGLFEQAFQRPEQKQKAAGGEVLPKPLILGLIIGGTALTVLSLCAVAAVGLYFAFRDSGEEVVQDERAAPRDAVVINKPEVRPPAAPQPKVINVEAAIREMEQHAAELVDSAEPAPAPVAVRPQPEPQPVEVEPEVDPVAAAPLPDPKPLIPPIPVEKVEISDAEIREFTKTLGLQRKAVDAHALFEAFSQSYAFTEPQQELIASELAEWRARADADLYRLGNEWVPLAEVEAAEGEADQLIERASALIEVYSIDECIQFLEEASRVNPNGIKADYILGLIYSLPFAGPKAPDTAESHFRKVLQRHPDHPAALNSIAIAQIKQAEFGVAVTNLSRAAELLPECQEVAQNVGRLVLLAQSGRAPVSDSVLRRYTDLYAELIAAKKAVAADEGTGWLHMVPVFPSDEREQEEQAAVAAKPGGRGDLIPMFGGTGFVVAPELIMTNRHVVYNESAGLGTADAVGISDPTGNAENRLTGTVLAVSDTTDLALVRVPGLHAPSLRFRQRPLPLASDVIILGYPRTDVLGTGMKASRGVVSALPDESRPEIGDYYLFDAVADHGNSGGPIIDQAGNVVAIATVITKGYRAVEADLTGGVASDTAMRFLETHVGDPDDEENAAEFADWAATTEHVSPSVVRLTCFYKAGVPSLQVAAQRSASTGMVWEDATCPHCNGWGRLPCPRDGCLRGEVSIKYFVDQIVGQAVLRQTRFRKETCGTCNGASNVDCPGCVNGFDRFLR